MVEVRSTLGAESQLLQEEHARLSKLAQEGFREQGRGAILIGRSQSLAEIVEEEDPSGYLVDYLALAELRDPFPPKPVLSATAGIETMRNLMETYAPAHEFLAVFFGGAGFENVYRVRHSAERTG